VPSEKSTCAVRFVDIADRCYSARPGAGVFLELRVRCLEQDFDAVEGRDDGFGGAGGDTAGETAAEGVVEGLLGDFALVGGGGKGDVGGVVWGVESVRGGGGG